MKYKSHMVIWAERGEGFETVCRINDASTPEFQEKAELVDFGDTNKTTCKSCLMRFKKMLSSHDKEVIKAANQKP